MTTTDPTDTLTTRFLHAMAALTTNPEALAALTRVVETTAEDTPMPARPIRTQLAAMLFALSTGEKPADETLDNILAIWPEPTTDAIVIPRDSLPEVEEVAMPGGTGTYDVGGIRLFEGPRNANDLRHRARAFLALAEYLDAKHRPLAVGDRVRVVTPYIASGARMHTLAVGDVGTVEDPADDEGDIQFRRDGTATGFYIAAANVERIDDDPPRVGDTVRVDKAERADGETSWLPEVGTEHRVAEVLDDGDLILGKDDYGFFPIVAAKNVTVVKRAER